MPDFSVVKIHMGYQPSEAFSNKRLTLAFSLRGKSGMKFVSLFSGIGGFDLAFERVRHGMCVVAAKLIKPPNLF